MLQGRGGSEEGKVNFSMNSQDSKNCSDAKAINQFLILKESRLNHDISPALNRRNIDTMVARPLTCAPEVAAEGRTE